MAKRRFDLTEVKKGNNISWFIASQAYYTGCIKLSDESGKSMLMYQNEQHQQITP